MEPVTHVLTGACLARTGLNRRTAYATISMAIAAELPDIDTLWSVRGPVASFTHHRGITHTLLGIPFEAGLLLLAVYGYDRLRGHRGSRQQSSGSMPAASGGAALPPARWGVLFSLLVMALLSHILLDFTNNYGVRPFFPFDRRWFAGSFVFIFDPALFFLLLAGLVLPALFGLVGREIGGRRERLRGRGWARAALIAVIVLWCTRFVEHDRAVRAAQLQSLRAPGPSGQAGSPDGAEVETASGGDSAAPAGADNRPLLVPRRTLANPDPFSIFRWYTVTDFGPAYRLGVVDSRLGSLDPGEVLTKPQPSTILQAAEGTSLGRAYLDWSPMPLIRVSQGISQPDLEVAGAQDGYTVTFVDPRFMGDLPLLRGGKEPPLTGTVLLDAKGGLLAQGMGGRLEH